MCDKIIRVPSMKIFDDYLEILEQAGRGGDVANWPRLKPACKWVAREIQNLHDSNRFLNNFCKECVYVDEVKQLHDDEKIKERLRREHESQIHSSNTKRDATSEW